MMQKPWIKLCLAAALLGGLCLSARATDDTARFYGQWKGTAVINGQSVTVISVHDANGYMNYVVTPTGLTFAASGSFYAVNGIWTATPGAGNTGSYHFIDKDTVICNNTAGLVVTWRRDSTPLGRTPGGPSQPAAAVAPSPAPAVHDSGETAPAPRKRGVVPDAPVDQGDVAGGDFYALIIGIDDYTAPLPKLKTAVNDAQSVANLLSTKYGFRVTTLLNQDATRDNILKAITHFRKSLAENDSFLIYYAGHGSYDRETEKGYWLPVDADPDPLVTSRDISADDLTTEVRGLAARHVIIISDSCFSGDLSRGAGDFSPSDGSQAYIHRMLRAPSRTLMASGSDEPVSDSGSQGHSVFANLLIQAMQSHSEPSFTAEDLFVSIRKPVLARSGQSPQYTALRDTMRASAGQSSSLDTGDFVFKRKGSAGAQK